MPSKKTLKEFAVFEAKHIEPACGRISGFREFWKGYTQAMAFTATDDSERGDSLFDAPGGQDFRDTHDDPWSEFGPLLLPSEWRQLLADCLRFVLKAHAAGWLDDSASNGDEMEDAGMDFHYTRNHHGVGFWDTRRQEYGGHEKELAALAYSFPERELYGTKKRGKVTAAFI